MRSTTRFTKTITLLAWFGMVACYWRVLERASPFQYQEFKISLADRHSGVNENPKGMRWAIFSIPKPLQHARQQLVAFQSWKLLSVPPQVFIVVSDDMPPGDVEYLEREYGVHAVTCKTNTHGLPLQNAMFELASREQGMEVVAVVNSDIILYDDFIDALKTTAAYFDRFLLVGARYDVQWRESLPSAVGGDWLSSLREVAYETGALHTYGGADYFAWRPHGDPFLAAIGSRIPPFTYGRSKADNWIIHTATQKGLVSVVDGTMAIMALHMTHGYENRGGGDGTHGNASAQDDQRNYTNHWSSSDDGIVNFNKYLAYTFGTFKNGNGTPAHAPWELTECVDPQLMSKHGISRRLCLRHRLRPATCPCTYNPYVHATLSEVETEGKSKICGSTPLAYSQSFEDEFALAGLLAQQAERNTVVLLGFNYGYRSLLLNTICRLRQLNVTNYVIAAFGGEAFQFCQEEFLPCFPVEWIADPDSPPRAGQAFEYGTINFIKTTKLKSQQVLRLLNLGYDVLWSDVDVFWKSNPLDDILASLGNDVAIAVQSNAPPEEQSLNGLLRINSGFYFVRNSNATRVAFRNIVDHAQTSSFSEQPSFYSILCGDEGEYRLGYNRCLNDRLGVLTFFLDRSLYPNGAMDDLLDDVTIGSTDAFKIIHFNWRTGQNTKSASLMEKGMWLLDAEGRCNWSL